MNAMMSLEGIQARIGRRFYVHCGGEWLPLPTFGPSISKTERERLRKRAVQFRKAVEMGRKMDERNPIAAKPAPSLAIIRDVATLYGVPVSCIRMNGVGSDLLHMIRSTAIARVADKMELSLTQIGNLFGYRDHSTIRHCIACYNRRTGENVRGIVWKSKTRAKA